MSEKNHQAVAVIEKGAMPDRVHPVVAAAMHQSPDPETLRELLAVQREWEAGEARKAYSAAMVELKRDLPTVIRKDATVDFKTSKGRTHYKHATLAGVMDAITEPLTRHGFSLTFDVGNEKMVRVRARLTHSAGHFEEAELSAPPDNSGNKNPVQQVASTVTYLQRYTALSLLGIATADMQEPTGEPPASDIDTALNMRAAKAMADMGLDVKAAEQHVGRKVSEWTAADLDKLRAWTVEQAK